MKQYLDNFTNWRDVCEAFGGLTIKEPKYVFAGYDVGGYEGSALLVTSDDGIIFTVVEGSHCSCYGLESCYNPTEHFYPEVIKMANMSYRYEQPFKEWLAKFDINKE